MRIAAAVLAVAACSSEPDHPACICDAAPSPDGEVGPTADVHRIGRFDGDRFAWPGTTIRTRFAGTAISVELDDGGQNQFDVWIDGEPQQVLRPGAGVGTYLLADGLAPGEHDLAIARRTESFFGITELRGFPGATLVPTEGRVRHIELIGDSITCGYGVLGGEATCPFGADTEAETHAWGALAAEALGADHTAIAYSGKGMVRNYGGDTADPMPAIYGRTFADDPSSGWDYSIVPDVVVIALGTNDFSVGDPGEAFLDAYTAFLGELRERYPEARFVLATSPMLSGEARSQLTGYVYAAAVAEQTPDVVVLELDEQLAEDGYGCDYHPNRTTQEKMAAALVARIRDLAGW